MRSSRTIKVRALRTSQGANVSVFTFFLPGADILAVARISRIERNNDSVLHGFQRREIKNHVKSIVEFLESGPVLFPNAIILALSPEINFVQSRGPKPKGVMGISQVGILHLPLREEGKQIAWIVDGQQRSLALAKAKNAQTVVPIVAFLSDDLEIQREQFILVNKARPLPVRLINELLPEVSVLLPRDLAPRKLPSELCNILNTDPDSPFYKIIRRTSINDQDGGVVNDSALINVLKNSIRSTLGALAPFKNSRDGEPDVEEMYKTLLMYWKSVQNVFPDAWGKPPTESRLMHSVGIEAMGYLMDKIVSRAYASPDPQIHIQQSLASIAPYCHWTDGEWEGLGMSWNEFQSLSKHIKLLSNHLIQLDYEVFRAR